MLWESIRACGSDGVYDGKRMVAATELGALYVRLVCGEPPPHCEVGVMWHEHDLADYTTVGLSFEDSHVMDPPWDYIARAEEALSRFDDAVDWERLWPDYEDNAEEDAAQS